MSQSGRDSGRPGRAAGRSRTTVHKRPTTLENRSGPPEASAAADCLTSADAGRQAGRLTRQVIWGRKTAQVQNLESGPSTTYFNTLMKLAPFSFLQPCNKWQIEQSLGASQERILQCRECMTSGWPWPPPPLAVERARLDSKLATVLDRQAKWGHITHTCHTTVQSAFAWTQNDRFGCGVHLTVINYSDLN